MAHERIKPEFLFDEEKIKQLKRIAPECFEDGKINFETLRQNLGDWVEDDEDGEIEHFGLFWPGKKKARQIAAIPPEGTLEPVYGEGLKPDGTPDTDGKNDSKNIFIEGENLEVLKIMQKSYANKIKMIYIDPPYNTGNDFVYDDNFTEPLQEYLRRTGQIDEEGKPLTTNKRSDGRFHSKWLSMMYPRLRLARNLLTEDGVIFVSIDDNEVHNLRAIMNEIFGEENFRGCVSRPTGTPTGQGNQKIMNELDYVLIYSKTILNDIQGLPFEKEDAKIYNQEDEKGKYLTRTLRKTGGEDRKEDRPSMAFGIKNPEGETIYPIGPTGYESRWRCGIEKFKEFEKEGLIEWKRGKDNKLHPFLKFYLEGRTKQPGNLWKNLEGNKKATTEVTKLFGAKVFDYPKPLDLLLQCLKIGISNGDIVLDFFAGSGTTGHASFKYNLINKSNIRFILVQLPHKITTETSTGKTAIKYLTQKNKPLIITELTKLRLILSINETASTLGFKVFDLKASNYKKWKDYQGTDIEQASLQLENYIESPLCKDWNKPKLITELMLLEGFPLDSTQEEFLMSKNQLVRIESEMVPNVLLICLDEEIKEDLIENLELDSKTTFICFDNAISTQNKLRLSDKGLIKTI